MLVQERFNRRELLLIYTMFEPSIHHFFLFLRFKTWSPGCSSVFYDHIPPLYVHSAWSLSGSRIERSRLSLTSFMLKFKYLSEKQHLGQIWISFFQLKWVSLQLWKNIVCWTWKLELPLLPMHDNGIFLLHNLHRLTLGQRLKNVYCAVPDRYNWPEINRSAWFFFCTEWLIFLRVLSVGMWQVVTKCARKVRLSFFSDWVTPIHPLTYAQICIKMPYPYKSVKSASSAYQ